MAVGVQVILQMKWLMSILIPQAMRREKCNHFQHSRNDHCVDLKSLGHTYGL